MIASNMPSHTNPNRIDVSVVIPVLNGMPELAHQLDSLAAQQTSISWEVIVVNNGSTDTTSTHVESRSAEFPVPLRLVDASTKKGISHARNTGVSHARGPKIGFCDADDRVGASWVEAIHDALELHDASGGPLRLLTDPFDPSAPELPYSSYTETSRGGQVTGCNMAVRRSILREVGGFDEKLPPYGGEDLEFAIRLHKAGATAGFSHEQMVYFQPTTELRTKFRKLYQSGRCEVMIWRKHRDLFGHLLGARASTLEILTTPRDFFRTCRAHGLNRAVRVLFVRAGHVAEKVRGKQGL